MSYEALLMGQGYYTRKALRANMIHPYIIKYSQWSLFQSRFQALLSLSIYFGRAAISDVRSVVESQKWKCCTHQIATIPRVSESICIKEHHDLNKQQRKGTKYFWNSPTVMPVLMCDR